MAKFPIERAREEVGITPTTAVRADIDVSTGEEMIGRAISGAGRAILDLGIKYDLINAKTELAQSDISAADVTNKYFLELEANDDPETYGEKLNDLFAKLEKLAPSNRRARRIYNQNLASSVLTVGRQTRALAKAKYISKAQNVDFLLLQKAKENGDFTKYKASIINGVRLQVYSAKEGERLLDEADRERDIKEKNDTLGIALTQRTDEGILIVTEANNIINKSELLNANEKNDLLNQITNRSIQERNARDGQFANRMGDAAGTFGPALDEGTLTDAMIEATDLESVGDQKTKEQAFKQKWKGLLRDTMKRTEPFVTDNKFYDSLTVGSELVERGTKSPAAWETEFAEANAAGKLTETDRRTLRSKDIVATKSMQNRTFSDISIKILRPRLVEIRQGELAGMIEAQEVALKSKEFKVADALNFNIKKAQVQEWNYGRAYRELRSQVAQNPEWSQKQIFVAGDIIADNYDKDLSDLMVEFDNVNSKQAILTTPPDDVFQEIWKDLSLGDKSLIWEARMLGASSQEILGEISE